MKQQAKIWRLPFWDNVELLSGQFSTQLFPWHSHDTFCLSVVEKGIETIEVRGRKMIASCGNVIILNPNQLHTNYAHDADGYTLRTFYFSPDLLQSLLAKQLETIYFSNNVIHDKNLYQQFLSIHQRLEVGATLSQPTLVHAFRELTDRYAYLHPPYEDLDTGNSWTTELINYIDHHLGEKIMLAQMANLTHLSCYELIRKFKHCMNVSPFEYILHRRIEQAKQQLKQGAPLVVTALDCGFYDQPHFTRYFKRYVGVTPSAYQQACNILQD